MLVSLTHNLNLRLFCKNTFLLVSLLHISHLSEAKSKQCSKLFGSPAQIVQAESALNHYSNLNTVSVNSSEFLNFNVQGRVIKKRIQTHKRFLIGESQQSEYHLGSCEYIMADSMMSESGDFYGSHDLVILNLFYGSPEKKHLSQNLEVFKQLLFSIQSVYNGLKTVSFLVSENSVQNRFRSLSQQEVIQSIWSNFSTTPEYQVLVNLGFSFRVVESSYSFDENKSYQIIAFAE